MLNIKDIISLANAGYTAEQIGEMLKDNSSNRTQGSNSNRTRGSNSRTQGSRATRPPPSPRRS